MIRHTKRTLIFIIAILCVLVGIAGLILPLIPGLVFIAAALVLFSLFSPTLREWMLVRTAKYPKVHEAVLKIETFIRGIVGEI